MHKGSAISYLVHLCHATNMESHDIVDGTEEGSLCLKHCWFHLYVCFEVLTELAFFDSTLLGI